MNQNIRVVARVVANVDGWADRCTDGRTNGTPDPCITPNLRQARQQSCDMHLSVFKNREFEYITDKYPAGTWHHNDVVFTSMRRDSVASTW